MDQQACTVNPFERSAALDHLRVGQRCECVVRAGILEWMRTQHELNAGKMLGKPDRGVEDGLQRAAGVGDELAREVAGEPGFYHRLLFMGGTGRETWIHCRKIGVDQNISRVGRRLRERSTPWLRAKIIARTSGRVEQVGGDRATLQK